MIWSHRGTRWHAMATPPPPLSGMSWTTSADTWASSVARRCGKSPLGQASCATLQCGRACTTTCLSLSQPCPVLIAPWKPMPTTVEPALEQEQALQHPQSKNKQTLQIYSILKVHRLYAPQVVQNQLHVRRTLNTGAWQLCAPVAGAWRSNEEVLEAADSTATAAIAHI